MNSILLVEDSNMFGRIAKKKIEKTFNVSVFWAKSLAETEELLAMKNGLFSMALLDFNLPDAPIGEVVDRVVQEGISSLVFTSNISDEVRNLVWSKQVADYILKDDPNSLEYIITAMQQLDENHNNLILVVSGSPAYRTMLSNLLHIRKYGIINSTSGTSALKTIQMHPEIKLVITDYDMPGIDGTSLCQKIRKFKKADQLAIIGVSSAKDPTLGARFLKSGADDFIVKNNFLVEEFYSRVHRCLKQVNLFHQIRESAIRDFLTGLHNRRYFFEAGEELIAQCTQKGKLLFCALIDIDFFKTVNDRYGHDVGDMVIKTVAQSLQEQEGEEEILARIGGEEFCILGPVDSIDQGLQRCEETRQHIESLVIPTGNNSGINVRITISIGVYFAFSRDLDYLTKKADECLYQAKEKGRNRVVFVRE